MTTEAICLEKCVKSLEKHLAIWGVRCADHAPWKLWQENNFPAKPYLNRNRSSRLKVSSEQVNVREGSRQIRSVTLGKRLALVVGCAGPCVGPGGLACGSRAGWPPHGGRLAQELLRKSPGEALGIAVRLPPVPLARRGLGGTLEVASAASVVLPTLFSVHS